MVSGWVSIYHPELANESMNLADRKHKLEEQDSKSAKSLGITASLIKQA